MPSPTTTSTDERTSQSAAPETKPETQLALPAEKKAGPGSRFRLSAAEHAEKVLIAPVDMRESLLWFGGFLVNRCGGSFAVCRQILKDLGVKTQGQLSEEYLYQIATCRYFNNKLKDTALNTIRNLLKSLRNYDRLKAASGKPVFVHTSQAREIAEFIDERRVPDTVVKWGGIVAPTDIGKSRIFSNYATENNHGLCVHVECPVVRSPMDLQIKLQAAYNIVGRLTRRNLQAALRENINHTKTIIFDNVQNLYDRAKEFDQPVFNWLRELQDDTNFTAILSWTPWSNFAQDLNDERNEYLRQFLRRMGGEAEMLVLDAGASEADVRAVAESFNLARIERHLPRLVKVANQAWGTYTPLFSLLQKARRRATKAGSDLIEPDHLVWPAGL